eukprot:CAMPEP_0202375142 /NCGR_PEP_ID=MMETSP1127-20130417/5859_1 /ASSEMBLY_ACC=CAM_ASM_000462 /TAXON_ID=3047 /ORGANISM="Dunaliella tertiolecta, Strain CCMP1320" /LENGTH=48 /DNA_ID= /DNA_START= /DNA_END= /DNA_ORIENTATION=
MLSQALHVHPMRDVLTHLQPLPCRRPQGFAVPAAAYAAIECVAALGAA